MTSQDWVEVLDFIGGCVFTVGLVLLVHVILHAIFLTKEKRKKRSIWKKTVVQPEILETQIDAVGFIEMILRGEREREAREDLVRQHYQLGKNEETQVIPKIKGACPTYSIVDETIRFPKVKEPHEIRSHRSHG